MALGLPLRERPALKRRATVTKPVKTGFRMRHRRKWYIGGGRFSF